MPKKFQFVMDHRTRKLIDQIQDWTGEENVTEIIRQGVKDLHWRISESKEGRQVISKKVELGTIVYDSLLPITGKAD